MLNLLIYNTPQMQFLSLRYFPFFSPTSTWIPWKFLKQMANSWVRLYIPLGQGSALHTVETQCSLLVNIFFSFFFFFLNKYWIYFFLIFILYWGLVDLQCCVSFRCTAKWFSYAYTYIRSFSNSFPISVIAEYWAELPVLYSRSSLVICFIYSSVYMSIPNSQSIPLPHPFPQ